MLLRFRNCKPKPASTLKTTDGLASAIPTKQQLDWLELEIGVLAHYTMFTFVSVPAPMDPPHIPGPRAVFNANLTKMPDPTVFHPTTPGRFVDQWMESALAMGAKYAILVVKHGDGFVSWPTDATFGDGSEYSYSVKHSGWRGGKGDLPREFVDSARAHGLKPGFYFPFCARKPSVPQSPTGQT